jgi:glycine betaine/proline transport system permease protein
MDEFLGIPRLPLDDYVQHAVDWFVAHYRWLFQLIRLPIEWLMNGLESSLLALPPALVILVIALVAWRRGGLGFAAFAAAATLFVGVIGLWPETMTTLAVIFTAVTFAILIGIPVGILVARFEPAWSVVRPVLDVMQTTPSFVYLVPVIMLFGIGTVPGVIATMIFALPPLIRLTNLGLRQVPGDAIEAGRAFGSTEFQLLRDIRLPLALPSIMAGINQTLLLSMVMSSITAMIGAKGLGLTVLRGIGRMDVGLAAEGGISLVLMAMIFDRITQSFGGRRNRRALFSWLHAFVRSKELLPQAQRVS